MKRTVLLLFIPLILFSCHDMKKEVDLIVYNTTIYTLDSLGSTAESIAIDDGRIIAVGNDAMVRSRYWSAHTIDGAGLFVYPGFIDAHAHFSGFAEYLRYADLSSSSSFQDVLQIVKEYNKAHPGQWIVGRGWDQNKWPGKQFPDNKMLNQLFPDVPVVLTRVDGHAVLANEKAIRMAGLQSPFQRGEVVMVNGIPTGIFLERTADQIKAAIPEPDETEWEQLLAHAASLCHAAGLTAVNDAGIDREMILRMDTLQKAGKLKIRIDAMINPTEENMDYFMPGKGYSTPFLRVGSVKIYADGALGSRGACLLRPYSDDSSNRGILVTNEAFIRNVCKKALESGFQVNTHAIGDSAVRMVLHSYADFLKGPNDLRWRIEHAQVVHENDFELFGKYSIIPSVQATHATSDMHWAQQRLGVSRIRNAYAYKRLLDQNGWIPNGTDFPVEAIYPMNTFYAATARKDKSGKPEGGFHSENALSRLEALRSMTIWAAMASFTDSYLGSIESGKMGDLVILDQDLINVPENQILDTKILYTILGGEIVYGPEK